MNNPSQCLENITIHSVSYQPAENSVVRKSLCLQGSWRWEGIGTRCQLILTCTQATPGISLHLLQVTDYKTRTHIFTHPHSHMHARTRYSPARVFPCTVCLFTSRHQTDLLTYLQTFQRRTYLEIIYYVYLYKTRGK